MALANFDNAFKKIWSDRTLVNFDTKTVFGAISNRDYEGDAKKGSSVIINTLSDLYLSDYSTAIANGQMTSSDFDMVSQSLNIDKWFYINKRIDDLSKLWGNSDAVEKLVQKGGSAIASHIDAYMASLHTTFTKSGSFGTDTASAYVYEQICDMGTALMNNKVPVQEGDCFVIIPPVAATALSKDTRFNSNLKYLENGILDGGKINNLQVYVSTNAPASASGYWYIAGHPSAMALAVAIQEVRIIPNPAMFGDLMQALVCYGAKVVIPNNIYKLGVKIV